MQIGQVVAQILENIAFDMGTTDELGPDGTEGPNYAFYCPIVI